MTHSIGMVNQLKDKTETQVVHVVHLSMWLKGSLTGAALVCVGPPTPFKGVVVREKLHQV
jgi:hypothetical protein